MKNVIATIAIACCFTLSAQAQKTATWKGGAPGNGANWACAANWKEGRVPDEFSDVVIPDVSNSGNFQPVIRTETDPVRSIRILPGATLRIESNGVLEVSEPLEAVVDGSIVNRGRLNVPLSASCRAASASALASNR